jgi:hypothetical protein
MPKLTGQQAKDVQATAPATAGKLLLDDGLYAAQLVKVEENEGNEYPYWTWEFGNLHNEDGARVPGRQWNNTSTSPKSKAFMSQAFAAFGYTADSDTDEMLGEWVVLAVIQEIQTKGKNAGNLRNQVNGLMVFSPEKWDFDPEAAAASFKEELASRASSGGGGKSATGTAADESY